MKEFLKGWIRNRGFDVVRYLPQDLLERVRMPLVAECNLVVDAGANYGQWAMRLRQCGWSGRIESYEPIPHVAMTLREVARHDELWNINAFGLGAKDSSGRINVAGNECGASSLLKADRLIEEVDPTAKIIGSEVIELRRLDRSLSLTPMDTVFLKADVQGFELEVLKGADGIMNQIIGLELELSLIPLYESQPNLAELLWECQARGFSPVQIRRGFMDPRNEHLLQVDVLFKRHPIRPVTSQGFGPDDGS